MQNTPSFGEFPEQFRSIMKSSIEQAKSAFDSLVATSEKMMHSVETPAVPATGSLKALNEKMAAFTRANADANFNLALRLADARQMSDVVEMQNAHLRHQMETFGRQMEELRDLTMKAVREGSQAAGEAVHKTVAAMPTGQPHG